MLDRTVTNFAGPKSNLRGKTLPAIVAGKASRFLARHVRTRTIVMRNAQPMITFTFDDVPATACDTGAHILEQDGARGTFYVSGGGCGAASPGGRLATVVEVRALSARGHEIGCHTYSHCAAARAGEAQLVEEIERNKFFLQDLSPTICVRNFAYPYGDFSLQTKWNLEGRFDSCRTLIPGIHTRVIDPGMLRTWALENTSIDRAMIQNLIATTVRTNGWLILSSHDVKDEPSRFGVTPAMLEFAVSAARDSGCLPVTVAEALQLAGGASLDEVRRPQGRRGEGL